MTDQTDEEITDEGPTEGETGVRGDAVPGLVTILPTGGLMINGAIVGATQYDEDGAPLLTLNLGWLRLAGVRIRIEDDPIRDRHRGGVALER